jgi:hypothetical protein
MSHLKSLFRVVSAVCLALIVSGCVVEPAWGPYYHPHYHYWGY